MTADKNVHTCNHCGKEFKYESEKRRHEKSHSPQFQCKICSKRFSFISALRRHEKQHERSGTVTCDECRKDFRDEVLLKRHIKYAHGGSFRCDKCDTIFNSEPALRTHMQSHKSESEKRYCCSFEGCNKKFNFPHHLKHHELTHSNIKQHFCKICEKGFIQLHHLKTHLKTHSADSSLNCDLPDCNKKFTSEYAKKRHMSKYHIKRDNVVSSDSNSASDTLIFKSSTAYYDPNMCPFAELEQTNKHADSIFIEREMYQHIAEDLSKSNTDCREIDSKFRDNNNDAANCKRAVGRCIMKENNENCLCAQITKTLNSEYLIQAEDNINFNTLSINSDSQLIECCGGNCQEISMTNNEVPEVEVKTDGTVKIKEFISIDNIGNEINEVNDKNKCNEIKFIPFNSCKSVLGNCIVSGNGMIGDGCLCAKMAIHDQVTAQEIDDITPHPKGGIPFVI